MNTIIISNWVIHEDHLENVLRLIPELKKHSSEEEGNVSYQVYQSKTEPNMLTLFEEYISEEAVMQHVESNHYKELVVKQISPFLLERVNNMMYKI